MMIELAMPRVVLLLLLSGCVPDFQLGLHTFAGGEDGGLAQKDAQALDADERDALTQDALTQDALTQDAAVEDADLDPDTGEHPDAIVDSGEHPDAMAGEICNNQIDDDGDMAIDCADDECGVAVCPDDDQNDCTMAYCSPQGVCGTIPSNAVGPGWECRGTVKHEVSTACQNGLDDDDDTLADCHDEEDCSCGLLGTNLTCCPTGECRLLCL